MFHPALRAPPAAALRKSLGLDNKMMLGYVIPQSVSVKTQGLQGRAALVLLGEASGEQGDGAGAGSAGSGQRGGGPGVRERKAALRGAPPGYCTPEPSSVRMEIRQGLWLCSHHEQTALQFYIMCYNSGIDYILQLVITTSILCFQANARMKFLF